MSVGSLGVRSKNRKIDANGSGRGGVLHARACVRTLFGCLFSSFSLVVVRFCLLEWEGAGERRVGRTRCGRVVVVVSSCFVVVFGLVQVAVYN